MSDQVSSCLRGIYSQEEEELPTFKKGVPAFDTIDDCVSWMETHARYGSNPGDPRLKHIFTHLYDWKQVTQYLLGRYMNLEKVEDFNPAGEDYYYSKDPSTDSSEDESEQNKKHNRLVNNFEFGDVVQELEIRLNLPFHAVLNPASTLNCLEYLFHHLRCGIFVAIRNNKVAMFVPFVNRDYKNNWGANLRTDPPTLDQYYRLKQRYYRKENIIPDKSSWWANGNIICNEHHAPREPYTQYWGDNLIAPFKHMLEAMCRERCIPDTEFFFNKRDHPQLKANLTEPYDFVFDIPDKPLESNRFDSYAPILSFYCSPAFADIPVPTTEDWELASGLVFPPSFIPDSKTEKLSSPRDLYLQSNMKKFHVEWEDKVNTAFFRGNATGGGTNAETNQRIRVAKMCQDWNRKHTNGSPPLLDAGITNYNVRDKKLYGQPMNFTKRDEIGVEKAGFVEMYKQGTYKYIMYIEGHCAANRYSFLMTLGSVILKVDSTCEASEMWFFPLLKPYTGSMSNNIDVERGVNGADHVPVKSDLSNLREQIEWCRQNDEKCKIIAENARNKYQRCLSRESILDYMQMIMVKIAKRYERPPKWWKIPQPLVEKPIQRAHNKRCARDNDSGQYIYCKRCKRERAEMGLR